MIRALAFLLAALIASPAAAAGFQYGKAPDPDDQPLELAIWYPSDAALSSQTLGLFKQDVAYYGAIKGSALPLVVISHGTGGSAAGHYDTALMLAEAGFVVVAMSHTGDNYKDRGYSFTPRNFIDRPRHLSRVIDFMLKTWDGHDRIDPEKIGVFGHSAGATTVLIAIGGEPAMSLAAKFCKDHPEDWSCKRAKSPDNTANRPGGTVEWRHDSRLKAVAIAAPALGFTFTKVGLETVTAPVQLWRAENDQITPNPWNGDIVRDALPQTPEDHLIANAGHFAFLAPCNEALTGVAPEICVDAAGFDRAAFHREMNQALAVFFKTHLAAP